MKIILNCILLLFAFTGYAQTIPFIKKSWGGIEIKGQVNDSIPVSFIFDTGGGLNLISKSLFERLKHSATFKHYYTGFRHDGDRMDFNVYQIPSLTIGSHTIKYPLVGVSDILDKWGVDAILSLISFEKVPLTIDFPKNELRIESAASLRKIQKASSPVPIKVHQSGNLSLDIFVSICLNDAVTLDAEFDTGMAEDGVLLNSKYLNAIYIDTAHTKNYSVITPVTKRSLRMYNAKVKSLQFCGIEKSKVNNHAVELKDDMIHEGLIGVGYFRNHPFTIDISNRSIYLHH